MNKNNFQNDRVNVLVVTSTNELLGRSLSLLNFFHQSSQQLLVGWSQVIPWSRLRYLHREMLAAALNNNSE